MPDLLTHLVSNQSPGFTVAAGIICVLSVWQIVRLIAHVQGASAAARPWWMLVTATVAGVGVWTTHFVAMLGYRPDLALAYDLGMTLASALASIAVVGVPLALSATRDRPLARVFFGAVSGLGIGAMHITGMIALRGCGQARSVGLDIVACTIGAACMAAAQVLPRRVNPPTVTVVLITAAVCGTHFVSIAGTELAGEPAERLQSGIQVALSVLAATGTAIMLLGAFLALVAAKRFEAQKVADQRVLAVALQNMSNGILTVSAAEIVELFNERLCALLRLPPAEMFRGMSLTAFLALTGRVNGWDPGRIAQVLANHRDWMRRPGETRVEHVFDDGRTLSVACQPVEGGAVLTFDDVTQARRAKREISRLAYRDPLTDLANRRSLTERMARMHAAGRPFALLLLDLDRFKIVNDSYGHAIGDRLLVAVAGRLRATVGAAGFVARLGGDEMAVVTLLDDAAAVELAERIVADVARPYTFDDRVISVGCSIGVSRTDGRSGSDALLQRADIALYDAKRHGRGRAARYTPGMIEAAVERHDLENDLRKAIDARQFHLVYQPIMSLADDSVIGFEALIRWWHPKRGAVSPAVFIPLAEETGLIVPIGRWVLEEACREAVAWPHRQHVAVNVSAVQFRSQTLVTDITSALADSGLSPRRLEIELTETALVEDGPQMARALSALRELGLSVAMDDFGTGYSSLTHLRDLPLDRIKIDRSFVSAALHDQHAMAVMKAITQMGRDMSIPTVAEGIEDADQLALARAIGCDAAQGYLIGRPERPLSTHHPAEAVQAA